MKDKNLPLKHKIRPLMLLIKHFLNLLHICFALIKYNSYLCGK